MERATTAEGTNIPSYSSRKRSFTTSESRTVPCICVLLRGPPFCETSAGVAQLPALAARVFWRATCRPPAGRPPPHLLAERHRTWQGQSQCFINWYPDVNSYFSTFTAIIIIIPTSRGLYTLTRLVEHKFIIWRYNAVKMCISLSKQVNCTTSRLLQKHSNKSVLLYHTEYYCFKMNSLREDLTNVPSNVCAAHQLICKLSILEEERCQCVITYWRGIDLQEQKEL